MEIQEIPLKPKVFYCGGGQTQEQAAQRGCGDISNSTGYGPEERLGLDPLQRCLPALGILCFSLSAYLFLSDFTPQITKLLKVIPVSAIPHRYEDTCWWNMPLTMGYIPHPFLMTIVLQGNN